MGLPAPAERLRPVTARIRDSWAGRRLIALTQTAAASVRSTVEEVEACGATVVGVVTAAPFDPAVDSAERVFSCADRGRRLTTAEFDAWLAGPDAGFDAWLIARDPAGGCAFLGNPYTHLGQIRGRPVLGWRRRRWARLEDKTTIDELWRQLAVPAPPCVVCDAGDPALADRAAELDAGLGVVLARDSTDGFVGDAKGLRWARTRPEVERAAADWRSRSRRVRVAPFVAGVPCSILAFVLADGVAVFDPIEIVTLRDDTTAELVFCGSSTHWRPDRDAAEQIRGYARRVGAAVARTAGYRGMFSIDGILGPGGFRATELNPRHASGLGLRAGWPDFPLYLFQRSVQEATPGVHDVPPEDIEDAFRSIVRDHPSLAVRVPVPAVADGPGTAELSCADGAGQHRHRVTYRAAAGAVSIDAVDPPCSGGTVAPAVTRLCARLGRPGLSSHADRPAVTVSEGLAG